MTPCGSYDSDHTANSVFNPAIVASYLIEVGNNLTPTFVAYQALGGHKSKNNLVGAVSICVVFSPEAEEQIVALYRYIAAAASPNSAARYTGAIVTHCESLRTFPHRDIKRDDRRNFSAALLKIR